MSEERRLGRSSGGGDDGAPLRTDSMPAVDDPPKRVDSEMPRLRRFLKVTFLTWLPMVAVSSAWGGIDMAKTLEVNFFGSFLAGTIWNFEVVALPGLFIVATYAAAVLPLRIRGAPGALVRIALAMGSVILVFTLMVAVSRLATDEYNPWWRTRSRYEMYLIEALFLAPLLALVHGRIK